jgi:hypothetical protein
MKHARGDYNRRIQDSENKIPEDEPVFLIRGQDHIGHAAVRAWAHLHRLNGGSDIVYLSAMRHADLMEGWANKYGKPADLPAEIKS